MKLFADQFMWLVVRQMMCWRRDRFQGSTSLFKIRLVMEIKLRTCIGITDYHFGRPCTQTTQLSVLIRRDVGKTLLIGSMCSCIVVLSLIMDILAGDATPCSTDQTWDNDSSGHNIELHLPTLVFWSLTMWSGSQTEVQAVRCSSAPLNVWLCVIYFYCV